MSPTPLRHETEAERLDRNYGELLQELRVAQTGVQILFAFLLSTAFTPRFAALTAGQRGLYVATLTLAAWSAAALIAPVMYHRLVFRRRLKDEIVEVTHRCAIVGLSLLLLCLVGALALAAGLVVGRWSITLAVVTGVAFSGLWFLLPLLHRRRS
ncbi:MAG: DUF6328 family protein [Kineosporiaceae bacterium]